MKKISIVIPTYNHLQDCLKPCLESLYRNTDLVGMNCEVIVVANGCTDGTEEYVKSLGAPVKLLSFSEPMGFIRATNSGITASTGEYILFLNNDVQILDWGKDGWIRTLTDPLDNDPSLAATGSNRDAWAIDRWFLVGFCVMTRRRLLFQMGLLDETFGLGCGEDCDYCLKVQASGYKIRQVPVETDHWSTMFPIWHIGHVTFNSVPGEGSANTKILESKYPRTDKDREFVRLYSHGLQNKHLWE